MHLSLLGIYDSGLQSLKERKKSRISLPVFSDFQLQFCTYLERGHGNVGGKGVKLLYGILVIVTSPCKSQPKQTSASLFVLSSSVDILLLTLESHSNSVSNVLDSLVPDSGVKSRVDEDLLGSHSLLSELDDSLDSDGSSLINATTRPLISLMLHKLLL